MYIKRPWWSSGACIRPLLSLHTRFICLVHRGNHSTSALCVCAFEKPRSKIVRNLSLKADTYTVLVDLQTHWYFRWKSLALRRNGLHSGYCSVSETGSVYATPIVSGRWFSPGTPASSARYAGKPSHEESFLAKCCYNHQWRKKLKQPFANVNRFDN